MAQYWSQLRSELGHVRTVVSCLLVSGKVTTFINISNQVAIISLSLSPLTTRLLISLI